ncbi:hypothetical protein YC2023_106070 [Brassica napus]
MSVDSLSKKGQSRNEILATSNRTQDNEQVAKGFYHVRKVKLQSRCVLSANDDDGDGPWGEKLKTERKRAVRKRHLSRD